jgi:sodium pump decarboxylase gamma subunit
MFDINIGLENFQNTEFNSLLICLMGVGTVFFGLICLIIVCKVLGLFGSKQASQQTDNAVSAPVAQSDQPIENKQELLAAISAALAEELGTDVNGIRIVSFKKL